jgi:creatinine amidohydrolase
MAEGERKVRFEEMFPWEIAAAMVEAPLCYLPLGTLEWHGEHAAVGLDALKAHAVCAHAAERARRAAALLVDRSAARTCLTAAT